MQELITKYRPWKDGEKIEALFMFQAGTVWASLDTVYHSCLADDRFELIAVADSNSQRWGSRFPDLYTNVRSD